jgi:hypothetical protein
MFRRSTCGGIRRGEEIGEAMIVMRVLLSARRLLAAMLVLGLLAPTQPGDAQTLGMSAGLYAPGVRAPTSGGSPRVQQSGPQKLFLPLVVRQPQVKIEFGTGVDSESTLLNVGTEFDYGIERLYYRYTVMNASGKPYRTEWFVDNVRQPLLDDSGTILAAVAVFTNSFCSPTLGACAQPVPRGAYRVRFYIDDVFSSEATAVVQ